jgi:hypothetical protein
MSRPTSLSHTSRSRIQRDRRTFLQNLGGVAAASALIATPPFNPLLGQTGAHEAGEGLPDRARKSFSIRDRAARAELQVPTPAQITNGDENRAERNSANPVSWWSGRPDLNRRPPAPKAVAKNLSCWSV